MKTEPSEAAMREAEKLADYLMVNVVGQRATRLMLVDDDNSDLGGWGRQPLVDKFAIALDAARRKGMEEAEKVLEHEISKIQRRIPFDVHSWWTVAILRDSAAAIRALREAGQ